MFFKISIRFKCQRSIVCAASNVSVTRSARARTKKKRRENTTQRAQHTHTHQHTHTAQRIYRTSVTVYTVCWCRTFLCHHIHKGASSLCLNFFVPTHLLHTHTHTTHAYTQPTASREMGCVRVCSLLPSSPFLNHHASDTSFMGTVTNS